MSQYRRAANVAYVVDDDDSGQTRVYLSSLPRGPLLVLEGPGALIWQEALSGSSEDLVSRLARRVGLSPDVVRQDVESFLSELVERRLLEHTTGELLSPAPSS